MARYGWTVTTPASGDVITTAQLKRQLSIPDAETYHDTELDNMAIAAASLFEHSTRILLLSRVLTLTMDEFPSDAIPLDLPIFPVTTFTSIHVIQDGISAEWDSDEYDTDLVSMPNRVAPVTGFVWPESDDQLSAISMVMSAGYALADIPLDIKHSLIMLVAHWFENREAIVVGTITAEVPLGVRMIWDKYNMGETYLVGSHLQ